jgi:hypothetical protein
MIFGQLYDIFISLMSALFDAGSIDVTGKWRDYSHTVLYELKNSPDAANAGTVQMVDSRRFLDWNHDQSSVYHPILTLSTKNAVIYAKSITIVGYNGIAAYKETERRNLYAHEDGHPARS